MNSEDFMIVWTEQMGWIEWKVRTDMSDGQTDLSVDILVYMINNCSHECLLWKKQLPTLKVKSQFKHINSNSKTSRLFQKREMHSCFILKFAAIFKNSGVFLPRQQTRGSSLDRPEGAPFRFMDSYKDAYLFRLCHYPLLNGNLG